MGTAYDYEHMPLGMISGNSGLVQHGEEFAGRAEQCASDFEQLVALRNRSAPAFVKNFVRLYFAKIISDLDAEVEAGSRGRAALTPIKRYWNKGRGMSTGAQITNFLIPP